MVVFQPASSIAVQLNQIQTMKTVYTEQELREAIKAKEQRILIKGSLAETIRTRKKAKTAGKVGLLCTAVAAAAAAPFTGGATIPVMGLSVAGLTAGTLTISTVELAIICGFTLGMTSILKGYGKVKFNPDGSIEIEK